MLNFGNPPFIQNETRTASDGNEYTYIDGCWTKVPPVDLDTHDGYSERGYSDGTVLDFEGNPIPAGHSIVRFYGPDGTLLYSKDCEELDTFAIAITAGQAGIDDADNAFQAGDILLQTAAGEIFCQRKNVPVDLIIAGGAGVDDAQNAYNQGDYLLQLSDGRLVCVTKIQDTNTQDGFSLDGVSTGVQVDRLGATIPVGTRTVDFFDGTGQYIRSVALTDENDYTVCFTAGVSDTDDAGNEYSPGDKLIRIPTGEVFCQTKRKTSGLILAAGAGTDDAGNAYDAGDRLIELADGSLVCAKKTVDTKNPFSINGYADGATHRTIDNQLIPAGARAIHYYDENANYINSVDLSFVREVLGDGVDNSNPLVPVINQGYLTDQGNNTAEYENFDGTKCDLVKLSAFQIDPVTGQCTLTLPGKAAIDIEDDVSIEVVNVVDNGNGTGDVTGTDGTTLTFQKPSQSWQPADPTNPASWGSDPANPGDLLSFVKNGNALIGTMINGVACEIPQVDLPGHVSPDGSVAINYNATTNQWEYTVVTARQELYGAGEVLPAWMIGTVTIVTDVATNATVALGPGDTVPAGTVGTVIVDEITGLADCIPNKAVPVIKEEEIFQPGDTLPADMVGTVEVCLDDQTLLLLNPGDTIPGNTEGRVIVDEVNHLPAFTQRAVKPTPMNGVYVPYNPALHVAGAPTLGDGTAANPFQYPLPPVALQELFCAGEVLPVRMANPVMVIDDDDNQITLAANSQIPANVSSCIYVDEITGIADCFPNKRLPTLLADEIFVPGDTLPASMVGSVDVCDADDNIFPLVAGDTIPANVRGRIIVDEVSGEPAFTQVPVKAQTIPEDYSTYVAYDPAVHVLGAVVAGSGTQADPWQIPLPPAAKQEMYCGGQTLPAWMTGSLEVEYNDSTITVTANSPLPADLVGCVFVDEVSGMADCIPNKQTPVLLDTEIYGANSTLPADMQGSVEVCLDDDSLVTLNAGDTVPTNIRGKVIVDEVSNEPAFTQLAVKPSTTAIIFENYDPAVHQAGAALPGSGTAADPFRTPVMPQLKFRAGETLPANMLGSVTVCRENDVFSDLEAGDTVPADIQGSVLVDPTTRFGCFNQFAVKATPPKKALYFAGQALPAGIGPVIVCLANNGGTQTIAAGGTLPTTMEGHVDVDEDFGTVAYVPPKQVQHCCVVQAHCNAAGGRIYQGLDLATDNDVWLDENGEPYTGSRDGYEPCD